MEKGAVMKVHIVLNNIHYIYFPTYTRHVVNLSYHCNNYIYSRTCKIYMNNPGRTRELQHWRQHRGGAAVACLNNIIFVIMLQTLSVQSLISINRLIIFIIVV